MTSAKSKPWTDESRRRCLKQAATLAGTAPLASALGAAVGAATAAAVSLSAHAQGAVDASNPEAAPSGAKGYQSSSPDEAAFVETLVNVMCLADELTPNGVDCGLATFIDRQLADGYRSRAARAIKDVIDNTPDMTSAARRLFGKSVTHDRLRAIFPDQETYNDLARTLLAETPFQQVRNTVPRGSPRRRPLSAEVPMIIERFDRRGLGRLAAELHRQAQDIAEESDLSFADQRAAHPGPEIC